MKRSREALVLLAALVVLLQGCGSVPRTGQASPARVATATPASGTRSTSPSPAAQAGVFGTCKLPIGVPYNAGEVPAGWLSLPGGNFSRDPASLGVDPSNIIAWDAGADRWVPTTPPSVSPDGSAYVTTLSGDFKIVDARTGATLHEVQRPQGVFPNFVFAYTATAIYIRSQGMSPPPGVWKLDPTSGQLTQVSTASGFWEVADDTAAWGTDTWATVRRLDLKTGAVTDVYKSTHRTVDIAGLVGSGVLVFESGDVGGTFSVTVVQPDGSATPVAVPAGLQGKFFNGYFQDGSDVLISGHGFGVAAFDETHGLQVLTQSPDNLELLGPCSRA